MRKLIFIPIVLAALGASACNETYTSVPNTRSVVVIDADGQADRPNVQLACDIRGGSVVSVKWFHDGEGDKQAIVECSR